MNIRIFRTALSLLPIIVVLGITGCRISYSFTGTSISPLAQTVSIAYFPNNAAMVAPTLSATLTDELKDRFARQTRLNEVREGGDLHLEGEIVNYTSTPSSISGAEYAVENRLTITVRVRFTNTIEPHQNFERSFSAYGDYPSSQMLQDAESSLIPEIVETLVEDIFNAAVAQW